MSKVSVQREHHTERYRATFDYEDGGMVEVLVREYKNGTVSALVCLSQPGVMPLAWLLLNDDLAEWLTRHMHGALVEAGER